MKNKMKDPQEIEVFFVLPAIRRDLALALRENGLDQKSIAKLLNVTEPAVSQYIHQKRANKEVNFNGDIQKEIKLAAKKLQEGHNLMREMQLLLKKLKQKGMTCNLCHQHLHTPEHCDVCV